MTIPVLKTLGAVQELEFLAVNGQPVVLAKGTDVQLHASMGSQGLIPLALTSHELTNAVQKAWPGLNVRNVEELKPDDLYGHLRGDPLPEQTLRVVLDDPRQTWVHIDRQTGAIVSVMDQSRRIYRWLFNGLHRLDLPGLIEKRPLWDIVMLSLLALGFLLSLTGVVLGWRRILHACRFP